MITYRFWCHDGDWKRDSGRHCVRNLALTITVKRKSKRSESEIMARVLSHLATIVPCNPTTHRSRKPEAFLESVSSRGFRDVLLRAYGKTTAWRLGQDGHSSVEAGGDWLDASGRVIVHAGDTKSQPGAYNPDL